MQDYRKLRVWQHSHELALRVRRATDRFPRTGYASLRSQRTDAAESISFNIVEGCGTNSQADLARFLEFSIKSSMELEYQLKYSRDYGILAQTEWEELSRDTVDARRMLCGFRAKVRASCSKSARNNGKRKNGKREPR
jgi:four helix bundle protein